jgi:hypothetical protein
MGAHRIRLRKPWHFRQTAQGISWQRAFHRPTGLGPEDRVWIVLDGIAGPGTVSLNDRPLGRLSGEVSDYRLDATGFLLPRNELAITLERASEPSDSDPLSPAGDVYLEICGP